MLSIMQADSKTDYSKDMQALVDILSRYKVDYVVTAYDHDYARTEEGGATYLVSVPRRGDARLEEERTLGDLHHALALTVSPDTVSERFVFAGHRVEAGARHFATAKLFPFLRRHPALTIVENLLMLGMFCVLCASLSGKSSGIDGNQSIAYREDSAI
jgi:hypothetical protein